MSPGTDVDVPMDHDCRDKQDTIANGRIYQKTDETKFAAEEAAPNRRSEAHIGQSVKHLKNRVERSRAVLRQW